MIKKKICLLGAFGVGKTSLIRKYVLNLYSDTYMCTVGVKVDKKQLVLASGDEVTLMIWDLEGKDDYQMVADTYLRGMSGYLLVADGTRRETLQSARNTRDAMVQLFPNVPSLLLLNKSDLVDAWALGISDYAEFTNLGIDVNLTSAKEGIGVEQSFLSLAERMAKA